MTEATRPSTLKPIYCRQFVPTLVVRLPPCTDAFTPPETTNIFMTLCRNLPSTTFFFSMCYAH